MDSPVCRTPAAGVIAVFRNQSNVSAANVQLPLMPAGSFKVHSVVTNKDLGTFTKDDWARGVPVDVFRVSIRRNS